MNRTGRIVFGWLALVVVLAVHLGVCVSTPVPAPDLDSLGQGCLPSLLPPEPSYLFPLLDEPLHLPSALFDPRPPATDDGYRLPPASRAPPAQA
jgi:hypothetical protein